MADQAIVRSIESELRHYPGVRMTPANGGKHDRLVFEKNGNSRFLTVPRSASDHRANLNAVRDFRKTMQELGANRLEPTPLRRRKRRHHGALVTVALNKNLFILHFAPTSPLAKRVSKNGRPTAHWKIELRASPDLEAGPMVAMTKVEIPEGMSRQKGITSGFATSKGAWRLALARSSMPALTKLVSHFSAVEPTLYSDTGDELVFKLPAGVIPTGFKARSPDAPQQQQPIQAPMPTPEPVQESRPVAPAPAPVLSPDQPLGPLYLQMPKPTVSIEQAIAVLNKAKQRCGNNLRFSVVEGGFLTAVHSIGR